jgi:hypothetical protein
VGARVMTRARRVTLAVAVAATVLVAVFVANTWSAPFLGGGHSAPPVSTSARATVATPSGGQAAPPGSPLLGASTGDRPRVARGVRGRAKRVRPNRPVPIAEGEDGCDHRYGRSAVCVPWVLPRSVGGTTSARCAYLRMLGLSALRVHRRDRLHLDSNHDGIACGPHDG